MQAGRWPNRQSSGNSSVPEHCAPRVLAGGIEGNARHQRGSAATSRVAMPLPIKHGGSLCSELQGFYRCTVPPFMEVT